MCPHLYERIPLKLRFALALALAAGIAAPVLAQAENKAAAATQPASKKVVKTAADLPVHTYKIEGKASEFLVSDKPFKDFVAQLKADYEKDLAECDIQDKTTLQGFYNVLAQIALFEHRDDDALKYLEKVRDLEGKESKKLMTGQTARALAAADKAGPDEAAKVEAFKATLRANVSKLPWDKVRDEVTRAKGMAELIRKELILGQVQAGVDPVVASSNGELSNDLAKGFVGMRVALDRMLAMQPAVAEVYSGIIAANATEKKDIWPERLATLTEGEGSPVVIGVWDSGVDITPFAGRVYVNSKEIPGNGKDDDNNGFTDDANGIAFELDSTKGTELLVSIKEMKGNIDEVSALTKGLMDKQANVDSSEAADLAKKLGTMKPEDYGAFFEDLNLYGNYSHGTHVAGISQEGNPNARLLPARLTFDFREIPLITPSVEEAKKLAKMYQETVDYFKAANVRVVNMSWGGSYKDVEVELEKKGVGKSTEERATMAREIFKIGRDGLEAAMKSAPNILFVAAAGNSDNDNTFAELIPSGLNLPNLITVGAVDQSGKPTGFTTFGKNVALYANGFEVLSNVPGGKKMKFSGTSMAAPNVTNLAAKLFSVNPKLTVGDAIAIMKKGADPMEGYEGRFVINPKKSVEIAKSAKPGA